MEKTMHSTAASTLYSIEVQTPAMLRNSRSVVNETEVGENAFGQLFTASRPPTAPSAMKYNGTSVQAQRRKMPVRKMPRRTVIAASPLLGRRAQHADINHGRGQRDRHDHHRIGGGDAEILVVVLPVERLAH